MKAAGIKDSRERESQGDRAAWRVDSKERGHQEYKTAGTEDSWAREGSRERGHSMKERQQGKRTAGRGDKRERGQLGERG